MYHDPVTPGLNNVLPVIEEVHNKPNYFYKVHRMRK